MLPIANYGMITVHHLQFTAMPGKILASPVRELLAVAQVEPLDVVAVLRERRQRRVTHRLENQESLKNLMIHRNM